MTDLNALPAANAMRWQVARPTRNVTDIAAGALGELELQLGDPAFTIALMNHKLQKITQPDIDLFHETFGNRAKLTILENGIMPSARGDYRFYAYKIPACSTPKDYFFIAHDGRVALCCSDQDLKHVIGDLKVETIDEIWFNSKNQITFPQHRTRDR